MGLRNDLRKEVMGLPGDGSVMTAEDVADFLACSPGGWALLKRFTAHHNALVNGTPGKEGLTHEGSNVLKEPVYRRVEVQRWIEVQS